MRSRSERDERSGGAARRLLCTLLALAALHAAGLALFARGFLLTRVELAGVSGCGDAAHLAPPRAPRSAADTHPAGCWLDAPVRKAVLLIIDGLRWDIAAGHAASAVAGRNLSLPSLRTLTTSHAAAALLPFIADPPTTTQQRLKGLLTGGLPTFVDVGSSFGAPALREDNLVAALRAQGRRVALLGDDTWLQLFPDGGTFAPASRPFPSFNVADLHTVDAGVTRHLAPLLADHAEWDVLIAHFLGVDHAGHTHGVDSAEMAAKLAELDAVVLATAAALAADASHEATLLIVMGDHGMTWQGDHGGGSDEEVRSALFALRPHRSGGGAAPAAAEDMPQIDFAPTAALLLGVPPPFGSVGRVCGALWAAAGGDAAGLAAALRANAWQVARAVDAYAAKGSFQPDDVAALRALHASGAHDAFLRAAAALARAQWASFRAGSMAAGLATLAAALVVHAGTLHAALGPGGSDADAFATMAAVAAAAVVAHIAGAFSVGAMQEEQAAAHAPMCAVAAAHAALVAWQLLRAPATARAAARARLRDACALVLATAGIAACAMRGEDKPSSEAPSSRAVFAALAPLLLLPRLLLPPPPPPGAKQSDRAALLAATVRGCHAAVGLHWAAHAVTAAGWALPPALAHAARIALPRVVFVAGGGAALFAASGALDGGSRGVGEAAAAASRGVLAALCAPLLLLTGRAAPLLALLAAAQGALILRCHTPAAHAGAAASPLPRCGLLSLAAASHFAALQLFAATGHRSSFEALHFKAAFTGFDEFGFARQGALLAANTWSAELAAAAALPLLAAHAGGGAGDAPAFWRALAALLATRGLLRAAGAAAAAAAAAVLRRHLHVWALFAPKFVFEGAGLLLADALALATAAAAARTAARRKKHAA